MLSTHPFFKNMDIQMVNTISKKELSLTNHKGNENQNHNEISPHTC